MRGDFNFTSESVTEGHPDKVCDQISDAILDDLLRQDPESRVAVETLATTGSVHVSGEVTTQGYCDVQEIVRRTLKKIGYTNPLFGIDHEDAGVWVSIHKQSPNIAQGVNTTKDHEQGAGDQGMMFGYANRDTQELMPLPIFLAHNLTRELAEARKTGRLPYLRPDGKSQVTVIYKDDEPVGIKKFTIAAQHGDVSYPELREGIIKEVIMKAIPQEYLRAIDLEDPSKFILNGTGVFIVGGPEGDTGLTGRKIIVDTYGGFARHGGGAFSGKDPSKVDRSAAYMARHIAKSIVGNNLADRCEVQLAYTIGLAEPDNLMIDTFDTGEYSNQELEEMVRDKFSLKPRGIIEELKLKNPIYSPTASYGHFGRKPYNENGLEFFTWEKVKNMLPEI
jgi:S-adenosylmethionine synthetase